MNVQQILKITILGALFLSIASPVFAETSQVAACATISRNLWVGMNGADVKLLQEVLNRNKETQLAQAGPGSPGNETMYFGLVTKAAVMRFQEMYKDEVLTPVGLTSGSGYVGTFTRAKMVALCNKPQASIIPSKTPIATTTIPAPNKVVTPATTTTPTTPTSSSTTVDTPTLSLSGSSGFESNTPVIMFPSSYTGVRGATITISGVGFAASGNIVHLDDRAIASTTTATDGTISFVVPSDVPFGRHDLWVSSAKGDTTKTFFIVTETNVAPPVVVDFTPKEGFYGTVVTVTGTGFLPKGNTIKISYGLIKDIPSADGKTLQFTVMPPALSALSVGEDRPDIDVRDPQGFYVMNDNGISDGSLFYLKI